MNDERVTTPEPYADVLPGNVAAARARLRLSQTDLAERMRRLGYRWAKQTVSEIEAGNRALRAHELAGLAIALVTVPRVLTSAPPGMPAVTLPDGQPVGAGRLLRVDQTFTWDGNQLKVSEPGGPGSLIDALITERREEAAELEAYRGHLGEAGPGEEERDNRNHEKGGR